MFLVTRRERIEIMNVSLIMLCLYLYLFTQAITVTAQSTYTRKSLTGSDVTLPCDYNQADDGDWFVVIWSVLIGGTFQNLYVRAPGSTSNSATPPPQFAGRLSIDGISNLRLTGVTIADEDQYRCIVTAQTSPTTMVNLQVFQQPSAPALQVQYDPQPSDMSRVPLNTTVTFTCTSTGGKPPASLTWVVIEGGTQVSVNPTYTSSNDSQGVGDSSSTFSFTTAKYGVRYGVECVASGPSPIQTQRSTTASFTTEPGQDSTKQPQTGAGLGTGGVVGIVIGVLVAIIVALALVYFLVIRKKRAGGGEKDGDVEDLSDRQYENVPNPMMASQRPGSGSDEYEIPMETVQSPTGNDDDYVVPLETVQPPTGNDDDYVVPLETVQPPTENDDDYVVPLETVQPPTENDDDYLVLMETVQPPQPSDDYQELRPAVYQSLQR